MMTTGLIDVLGWNCPVVVGTENLQMRNGSALDQDQDQNQDQGENGDLHC